MVIHPSVASAVQQALGASAVLRPLTGGTNERTFLAEVGDARWVVRSDEAPALSLQRAIAAQELAGAAGVRVPHTIAHGTVDGDDTAYFWCIETWHPGVAFDHAQTDTPAARAAITDLGQQLRRLHTVEMDAFGDLPPRPYDVYATFSAWVANKRRRIAEAVRLVGGDTTLANAVDAVYAEAIALYDGTPRLSKADCAGGNLLVNEAEGVIIIDWEWAQGLDPAADIAFWCRETPDPTAHALLLAAYAPDDAPAFGRRIMAHMMFHAVETIHVLEEHQDAFSESDRVAGFAAERRALEQLLD